MFGSTKCKDDESVWTLEEVSDDEDDEWTGSEYEDVSDTIHLKDHTKEKTSNKNDTIKPKQLTSKDQITPKKSNAD